MTKELQRNSIVNGVKETSWLMKLSHYDIRGTGINYMHCVLLGVTKLLCPYGLTKRAKPLHFTLEDSIGRQAPISN